MKNWLCALLSLVCCCSFCFAETVYVTISDGNGDLVLVHHPAQMRDADGDGAVTMADALTIAHEDAYPGGAGEGLILFDSGYGLSIQKLWGIDNGGSYGFFQNNGFALNLNNPVQDNDHVRAYAYTDLESWSDTFSYFDLHNVSAGCGEEFALNLSIYSYDADWNPVILPVEGALVTIDGQDTAFVSDAEGNVSIRIDAPGTYLISAHSDTINLVPPVCVAEIK